MVAFEIHVFFVSLSVGSQHRSNSEIHLFQEYFLQCLRKSFFHLNSRTVKEVADNSLT